VTSVVKLYWDRSISFVKNIIFVKTENALVLGDIQESDVIQVSKHFENNIHTYRCPREVFGWVCLSPMSLKFKITKLNHLDVRESIWKRNLIQCLFDTVRI
jgi:hypothetical protein